MRQSVQRLAHSGQRPAAGGLLVAVLLVLLVGGLSGCAYYSFTGATIPGHLQTIAIPLAEDNSVNPLTTLDEDLTALLAERFVGQTRLVLQPQETDADAVLSARITRYANEPTAVGGQERAQLNRVTITVAIIYLDQVRDEVLIDRVFTGAEEYDPAVDGPNGEAEAAAFALEIIAEDVFTAATSNW